MRAIQTVINNLDKQRTYAEQKERHKVAMKHGFYLEAMMIDYALIEDRLRSILYYMGLLSDRNSISIWKKTYPYLQNIVDKYKNDKEKNSLGISNISDKLKIVRVVFYWVAYTEGGYCDNRHLKLIKTQCESLDIAAILEAFDKISIWCEYRNEVAHALMNKNMDSLHTELEAKAAEGMQLANFLDSQVKIIKKGNKVRKSMSLD